AAGGARQEWTERDQVREGPLVEPAPAHHELVSEIPDVGDRPAEAGESEAGINAEHLERGPSLGGAAAHAAWLVVRSVRSPVRAATLSVPRRFSHTARA